MSIETDLSKLVVRQESMVQAMSGLAEIAGTTHALVVELMAWLQKPPSTDLRDALEAMAAAIALNTTAITQLTERVTELPATVARAASTGEIG